MSFTGEELVKEIQSNSCISFFIATIKYNKIDMKQFILVVSYMLMESSSKTLNTGVIMIEEKFKIENDIYVEELASVEECYRWICPGEDSQRRESLGWRLVGFTFMPL